MPPSATPQTGLGITRADAELLLSAGGMQFKADADYQDIKRTKGRLPRSFTSVELIGPDEGLIYIYLTFDASSLDAIGPAMGDLYLAPITDRIGDPDIAAWCRSQIPRARQFLEGGENYRFIDQVNGRRVSISAILATPGALVSCSMGSLPGEE